MLATGCDVQPRRPSAAILPLSFAHPPPCQPRHPARPSTKSVRLSPCRAQLPALLRRRFASRSNVLIALFNVQAFSRALFGSPPCPQPTMPSADFCMRIPTPLDVGSTRHPLSLIHI